MENDTTSISFQPISGAMSSTPFAYILHIDEFTILLDCGWSESFDLNEISQLVDICSHVNAVLLSHATIKHIGALPYLCQHGLSAPIFATIPVPMLGSLVMYDAYLNKLEEEDFQLFKAIDIDTAFQKVNRMTYSQSEQLDGKNITIIPYNAGNTLGGTVWRIMKGQNEVIYSVSVGNNSTYLSSFAVEQGWHPTLWILDAAGPDRFVQTSDLVEKQFWGEVFRKLDEKKIVMFPTDGVSGSLEVIMMLVEFWKHMKQDKQAYPIYFLSHSSTAVIKNSQSLSSFLSKAVQDKIIDASSPFDFTEFNSKKEIFKCITSLAELPPVGPCVVVASTDTLEHGFSREVFFQIMEFDNLIVFTEREPFGTLAYQFVNDNTHRPIQLRVKRRVPLAGQELLDYKKSQNAKQENELMTAEDAWELIGDDDDDGSDEDSDSDMTKGDSTMQNSAYQVTQASIRDVFQFKHKNPLPLTDFGCEYDRDFYSHGATPAAKVDQSKLIALNANEQNFIQEKVFPPSKFEEELKIFQYRATTIFYNKERAADYQTIAYNVTATAPPDIIIVGAEKEQTEKLKDTIKGKLRNTCIQTPNIGEQVSLQRDFSTRKISLSRALLAGLDFKDCGVNDVAYIEATLKTDEHQQFVQARPTESNIGHTATFIGTIDLGQLSPMLEKAGISNEFRNGVLECGQRRIKVRRNGDNGFAIEGNICAEYIKVRNAIQELLTMV